MKKPKKVKTVEDVLKRVEFEQSKLDISETDIVLKNEVILQPEVFNARAHSPVFYELCHQILAEYPFERGSNAGQRRFIFGLHTEGFTLDAITFWLEKSVYKPMSRSGVHKVIESIKEEFNKNIYSQKVKLIDPETPSLLKRNFDIGYVYRIFDLIEVRDLIEIEDKAFIESRLADGQDRELVIRDALDRLRSR